MSRKRPLRVYAGLLGAVAVAAALVLAAAYVPGFLRPAPEQSVAFSHAHHAGELGIDCRYCHAGVERAAQAGFPPMTTCSGCHYPTAAHPLIEPLRWQRVAQVADHVFFHHGIHVSKGIGCADCHGAVATMDRLRPARDFTMRWCLDCHRDPPAGSRPSEALTHCNACHR
ncbi:MAG: cytochrome c3 family protein [Rhodospirillaceae bacterium]